MRNRRSKKRIWLTITAIFLAQIFHLTAAAQIIAPADANNPRAVIKADSSVSLYLDRQNGMTADEAVRFALENNGEIRALSDEVEAARALVRQAALRANPKLRVEGGQEIIGRQNNLMVSGGLPLELGGRREARVAVAESELQMRENMLANRERLLAAEVREEFGEALAQIKKLELVEDLLANVRKGYELIAARVTEGQTPPLEQNMTLVEVNRLRSMRENAEGNVEVQLLELRNLLGMQPAEPLRLDGDFNNLIDQPAPLNAAIEQALRNRPDLEFARTAQELAEARLNQARAEAKPDASVMAGYQRMNRMMPVIENAGVPEIQMRTRAENFVTFGVEIDLPVRNRNQGLIAAAVLESEAARKRIEFGELTIRREVTAAYARFERSARALTIFRAGVREQAGQNLQVVWQTYELGSKSLLDYIAEERRYLDVENSLIEAELETFKAKVEILRTTNAPELK